MNVIIHRDSHRPTADAERIKLGLQRLELDCLLWVGKGGEKDLVDPSHRLVEGTNRTLCLRWHSGSNTSQVAKKHVPSGPIKDDYRCSRHSARVKA